MATIVPADHHATFAGWSTARGKSDQHSWSRRRQAGFFMIAAIASWILVLSPFLLLD